MPAIFMVRATVADEALRKDFDRVRGDKVKRSRDVIEIVQRLGGRA